MVFVSLPRPITLMDYDLSTAGPVLATIGPLNTATTQIGFPFVAPRSCNVKRISWRTGNVAQAPANGIRVGIAPASNTSNVYHPGTEGAFRVFTGIVANTWFDGILSADGTDTGTTFPIVAGQHYWITWKFQSFSSGDSWTFSHVNTFMGGRHSIHSVLSTTNDWTGLVSSAWPCGNFYISDTTENVINVPGWTPVDAIDFNSFSDVSNPDEQGNVFQIPVAMKAIGVLVPSTTNNTGNRSTYRLIDSTNQIMWESTQDVSGRGAVMASQTQWLIPFYFGQEITLNANVDYRITRKAKNNIGVCQVHTIIMRNPSIFNDWLQASGISKFHKTTRNNDTGSWQDIDVQMVSSFVPIISQVDPDPALKNVVKASDELSGIFDITTTLSGEIIDEIY